MNIMQACAALFLGYLFGNVPSGYLYARAHGCDIFKEGSGNPGSTNVLRTLGKKAGATVLIMDIFKTVIPIIIIALLFGQGSRAVYGELCLVTGLGVILGHDFTFLPSLKGGKGVACTGALLICYDLRLAAVLLLIFIIIVYITRYVSLGSIIGVSGFFISVLLLGRSGILPSTEESYTLSCVISFIVSALCVFQHRGNIKRLLNGTERKLGSKKK